MAARDARIDVDFENALRHSLEMAFQFLEFGGDNNAGGDCLYVLDLWLSVPTVALVVSAVRAARDQLVAPLPEYDLKPLFARWAFPQKELVRVCRKAHFQFRLPFPSRSDRTMIILVCIAQSQKYSQ